MRKLNDGSGGNTNRVRLCAGSMRGMMPLVKAWLFKLADFVGHQFARLARCPPVAKLVTSSVTGRGVVEIFIDDHHGQPRPSLLRTAANAASASGFGIVAETLMSPKVDLLPS